MANHYELLYLVSSNFTEEELAGIKDKVSALIKKFGGDIAFGESFGKKKLAYPIKHNHQGYYLFSEFDLPGEQLKELEKNLRLTNELLRHIVVKKKLQPAGMRVAPTLNLDIEPRIDTKPKIQETKITKPVTTADDDKNKLKLEDLDEKLDEILEGDIM